MLEISRINNDSSVCPHETSRDHFMSSVDVQRQCSSICSKTDLQEPRFSLSNYFRTTATFLKVSTVDVNFLLCPVVLERRYEYPERSFQRQNGQNKNVSRVWSKPKNNKSKREQSPKCKVTKAKKSREGNMQGGCKKTNTINTHKQQVRGITQASSIMTNTKWK